MVSEYHGKEDGNRKQDELAVNMFMPYKAPGSDGIYLMCLQEGLDRIIKYLIKVERGSMPYTKTM